MGMSKVVNKGNGEIVFVHQLDQNGKAYAEDITIKVQEGVDPNRLAWFANQDGKVGVASVSFSPYDQTFPDLQFPKV